MRVGLIQLNVSDMPEVNLAVTRNYIRQASSGGAKFVLTPEVTNCISSSRAHQNAVLHHEADDPTLAGLRQEAAALGIWLLIGSLGLKTNDEDGRFANRSFLIDPTGEIVARYDKIHMFDVVISADEQYQESKGYRPGNRAVVADTPFGGVGMTICYDVRFAALYRSLAKAGARILTVPAAFSPTTGAGHWHSLLRARAIETGCFVLAPAQTGLHLAGDDTQRHTYGHSLVVSPWGEVIHDSGEAPGFSLVDLDLAEVEVCRKKVPSLLHDRPFEGP
ncbi:carbon-nitrogen hydrolase family protein [Pseudogemmobacter sp. W21_MBD1_M6]|uniref:carbon-nitrogen hydrolase family protein n=1 Tax=Pseudogemmobacter sp. W21_MBD1_M6 TaxID=3240271 RepID=UPI003F9EAE2B